LKKGDKWQDNDLIFPTSKGTPLYHNWFCKKVAGASLNEEIAKRAGVRRISEHSLRKTGATILETELGASREIVKAALRHRRDSVTDVYVSYDAESLRPHIDKLAALVTDDLPSTFPQPSLKLPQFWLLLADTVARFSLRSCYYPEPDLWRSKRYFCSSFMCSPLPFLHSSLRGPCR
jgi:hypothetical protein